MPLNEVKMSLFDAPLGATLVHACNCRGVWGRGIALEMKVRFPGAHRQYQVLCSTPDALGTARVFNDCGYNIGCLMTSTGFKPPDHPSRILLNTAKALHDMLGVAVGPIYSNKFNSGLFNVAWGDTKKVLENILDMYAAVDWVVCDVG